MIEQSYWAKGRSYPATVAAIENSLMLDLYAADGGRAGFARLCDVFIDRAHRGRGLA